MFCSRCGSMLVSYTRGGWVVDSSTFTVMTNIFVTELRENIWEKSHYVGQFAVFGNEYRHWGIFNNSKAMVAQFAQLAKLAQFVDMAQLA